MPKNFFRNFLSLTVVIAVVVVLDQLTKSWALRNLAIEEAVVWPQVLKFALVKNSGIAFGLPFFYADITLFVIIIVIVVIVLRFYWLRIWREKGIGVNIAIGLIIGGAIGNLVDRFSYGVIVDFISIWKWPVFNIADVAIVVGTLILLWQILRQPAGQSKTPMATK